MPNHTWPLSLREACNALGLAFLAAESHRASMRPKRQTESAIVQVTTNIPTMTNPALLTSNLSNHVHVLPLQFSSDGSNPSISIVPITNATPTESAVIVIL